MSNSFVGANYNWRDGEDSDLHSSLKRSGISDFKNAPDLPNDRSRSDNSGGLLPNDLSRSGNSAGLKDSFFDSD
jgi:hypothetical protein